MRMVLLISSIVLFTSQAYAFRCGTQLVREGDHYLEVLRACGEPDLQEQWLEESVVARRIHRSLPHYRELTSQGSIIRLWTYNRGTKKFMRQLEFRDGFLKKIEKVGYGFN